MTSSSLPSRGAVPHLPEGVTVDNLTKEEIEEIVATVYFFAKYAPLVKEAVARQSEVLHKALRAAAGMDDA